MRRFVHTIHDPSCYQCSGILYYIDMKQGGNTTPEVCEGYMAGNIGVRLKPVSRRIARGGMVAITSTLITRDR